MGQTETIEKCNILQVNNIRIYFHTHFTKSSVYKIGFFLHYFQSKFVDHAFKIYLKWFVTFCEKHHEIVEYTLFKRRTSTNFTLFRAEPPFSKTVCCWQQQVYSHSHLQIRKSTEKTRFNVLHVFISIYKLLYESQQVKVVLDILQYTHRSVRRTLKLLLICQYVICLWQSQLSG